MLWVFLVPHRLQGMCTNLRPGWCSDCLLECRLLGIALRCVASCVAFYTVLKKIGENEVAEADKRLCMSEEVLGNGLAQRFRPVNDVLVFVLG